MTEQLNARDTLPPDAPRRRRWRWVLLAVAIGLAVVIGGAVTLLWGGRGADEASVDKAVQRFRGNHDTGKAGFLSPKPGVYRYRGTGTERLSVLDANQKWGPQVPVTVTATDPGCWTFRVEYSTNHVQEFFQCARDGVLEETGGRTKQRFDFGAFVVDDLQVFTCRPRGQTIRVTAKRGDSWRQSCNGGSVERKTKVTSAGTNTFVGRERVRVGASQVEANHYRVDRVLSGDQKGTEHNEFWYSVSDGLPLRIRRNVSADSPSPVGSVVYAEHGTLTITSLTPER